MKLFFIHSLIRVNLEQFWLDGAVGAQHYTALVQCGTLNEHRRKALPNYLCVNVCVDDSLTHHNKTK